MSASLLPDTFAVFILTHGRPDNVITYKTLMDCNYVGRLYLVVDNQDKTLSRYQQNFGSESVVVFDKEAIADASDEGNNFGVRSAILMARNACFSIAESKGITHFIQLDDDYYYFGMRFDTGAKKIKNINTSFAAMLRFFEDSGATSVAFSQGGDHIGGFSGLKLKRKAMNSFFCSTNRPFRFIGTMNEDVNTYTTLGSRGHKFFTFTGLQLDQKDTQSQSSGITDQYLKYGTYCKAFTTVMMMPSSVRVSMMQTDNPRLHHSINWASTVPCILPERWRKDG